MVSQGLVGTTGAYLLYPAVAPRSGGAAMVFTITSATIDPAAAFTTLGSNKITTIAPDRHRRGPRRLAGRVPTRPVISS